MVNCHQNTEAADLLGGLLPLRDRYILVQELHGRARKFIQRCVDAAGGGGPEEHGHTSAGGASPLDTMDVTGSTAAVQVRTACSAPLFGTRLFVN